MKALQSRVRFALAAIVAAATVFTSTGCSAPAPDLNDGRLDVVTATNVWANIATQVGGDLVSATALIEDASKDPHSFEASARDQLAVSKADLVITNGGGYDDFLTQLANAQNRQIFDLTQALEGAGGIPEYGAEHYWYSVTAVKAAAAALAAEFSRLDKTHAASYASNLESFNTRVGTLEVQLTELKSQLTNSASGKPEHAAFSTEPLSDQLLVDSGIDLLSNQDFSEAVENETDIPVGVLNDVKNLFAEGQANLLVVNEQTRSTQIDQLVAAARRAKAAVLQVTEQIPAGLDWLSWMKRNVSSISTALVRG